MAITVLQTALKSVLNQANPQVLADACRNIQLGSVLRANHTHRRRLNPNVAPANPYVLATLQGIALPDDAKAASILRATARAGTAAAGELTIVAYGVTPITTQIAVAPNGDIVFLATDAYTDVDVVYVPEKHDTVELTPLAVAANVATLPTGSGQLCSAGVILLMEVEALTGTAVGKKIILVPGAGAPAAGQARLNLAKGTVTFAGADAVTSCRLKMALVPGAISGGVDADAILTAASAIL